LQLPYRSSKPTLSSSSRAVMLPWQPS
jgi:hypothetical protein